MVKCATCGAPASVGTVFCTDCGARIEASPPRLGAPSPVEAPSLVQASARVEAPARSGPSTVPGSPVSDALKVSPPNLAPAAAAEALLKKASPPNLAPLAGAPRGQAKLLPAGAVVDGKYTVVRVLGEGGMGVVYLARDVHTGLEVVLKAIRAELAHRKDIRDRTLAEGRALAQIDHINVVHLNAVVAEGDELWLVMQYVDGESLEKTIARHVEQKQPMPLAEALRIFRQVLLGIGAAHDEGIVHRDLKPANILIRRKDGVAKVTDFGIAKGEADARAGRGVTMGVIGSLWYLSPEQVTGRRDLDKRVDIYALGIMLFEMLVGHVPFDAASDVEIMRMHTQAPVPWISKMRSDIPLALDEVIHKACAKERDQRFASAAEFSQALVGLDSSASAAKVAPNLPPAPTPTASSANRTTGQGTALPASPPSRSLRWLPIGLLGMGVLGSGAALFVFGILPRGTSAPVRPEASARAASPNTSASMAPVSSTPVPPPRTPLEELSGSWIGNGRELEAIYLGGALEFRIKRAVQFKPQDYQDGEARFVLRSVPGQSAVFTVEDHIRPLPPQGKLFAPASRGTCQEVWTDAAGKPLRATYDGKQLSVEFAKIEPTAANFVSKKAQVVSCIGLRKLGTAKVVSSLTRE